ncbi:hypothetical protein ACFQL1_04235 [Halomicroarcula sp. GCM10025709]|uniref:hypothetical protein n=1 Tax=Halomicroarcula sp. GCM10025709 TaxID=3252669 RepID=UPI00361749DC
MVFGRLPVEFPFELDDPLANVFDFLLELGLDIADVGVETALDGVDDVGQSVADDLLCPVRDAVVDGCSDVGLGGVPVDERRYPQVVV